MNKPTSTVPSNQTGNSPASRPAARLLRFWRWLLRLFGIYLPTSTPAPPQSTSPQPAFVLPLVAVKPMPKPFAPPPVEMSTVETQPVDISTEIFPSSNQLVDVAPLDAPLPVSSLKPEPEPAPEVLEPLQPQEPERSQPVEPLVPHPEIAALPIVASLSEPDAPPVETPFQSKESEEPEPEFITSHLPVPETQGTEDAKPEQFPEPDKKVVLTLNSVALLTEDLIALCSERLADPSIPAWERSLYSFLKEWVSGGEELVAHTSGSTGAPKEIHLTRTQMLASAKATGEAFGLRAGDAALLCLSAEFIAGKMMVVRAFALGLNLITVPPSSNPLATLPAGTRLAFAAMVPVQVIGALEDDAEKLELIDRILLGGAEVSEALENRLHLVRTNFYAGFGMTETVSHIALRELNVDKAYRVIGGVEAGQDERGCLTVKGAVTNHALLITNDLVEFITPQEFRWLGRIDHVFNSGGVKVIAEDLEAKVLRIASELNVEDLLTRRFAVSALGDDRLGDLITLVLEGEMLLPSAAHALLARLKSRLGRYETPRVLTALERFPETPNGKLRRVELRQRIQARQ